MVTVQIFGLKNSNATRAAERFFKERRIPIQFVDLKVKPMAPGEIRRFIQRWRTGDPFVYLGSVWAS